MMAYRLAKDMPDVWSGIWAMSASIGGHTMQGFTPAVLNEPAGTNSISLFAHHGDLDETVVPGPAGTPALYSLSTSAVDILADQGITDISYAKDDRNPCQGDGRLQKPQLTDVGHLRDDHRR